MEFSISKYKNKFKKCKGYNLTDLFENLCDEIKHMDIRDDDIWLCTFPKSGTTWVQEMIWCIINNVELEAAKESIFIRFPFLDSLFLPSRKIAELDSSCHVLNSIEAIRNLASPRLIMTHLPFNLLPEKLQNFTTAAKIIHVSRNPRDTSISFYYHCRLLTGFAGSLQQFLELFLEGNVLYGPFPDHIKEYHKHIGNPSILFLKYEDMKKDLKSIIDEMCNFLGKAISEEDVKRLLDHLSFSSMKENPHVNRGAEIQARKKLNSVEYDGSFMRRGTVGDWKSEMDSELSKKFAKWEDQYLSGIAFIYSV